MERLTEKHYGSGDHYMKCSGNCAHECVEAYGCENLYEIIDRLGDIEDILGDDYDLDRLRELVKSDRDGRCVVLPVKPGEKVRPKQSPYRKPEIVDCVTIYTGGRITYGFHEIGMRNEWVDRWEEEEAEAYIPDTSYAALKGEQDG